jgi:hypothetical protein
VADASGLLVPLTHYPPLFPAVLAVLSLAGLSPDVAARTLALGVTAANIGLVMFITFAVTRSMTSATTAGFVIALSVDMLMLNTAVWSDGLFIAFQCACLAFITAYLQGHGYRCLIAGAAAAALAWLTRWVGGAVVAAAAMAILVAGPGTLRRRLADGVLFAALATAPPAGWMLRNVVAAQTATNRTLSLSAISIEDLAAVLETIASWLIPGTNRVALFTGQHAVMAALTLAAAAGFVALVHYVVRPTVSGRASLAKTPIAFLLLAVTHIAAVLVGAALFDSAVPLDNRILAPAYVAAVPVVAFVLYRAFRVTRTRLGRLIGQGALITFLCVNAAVTIGAGLHFRKEGRGYVGPAWQYPTLRSTIARIAPTPPLLSNHPDAVEFVFGTRAVGVSCEAVADAVAARGRVMLVYFDNPRQYAPRSPEATRMTPSSAEYRIDLLRGVSATVVAQERNAWVYEIVDRTRR